MEGILQEHHNAMPSREILVALAEKFSESPERKGKIMVQMKQVWNWFQNRRYAIRAKSIKSPGKLNVTPLARDDSTPGRNVPQPVAAPIPIPMSASVPPTMPASANVPSGRMGSVLGRAASESTFMEFEAKSARDGAWYDVSAFLAQRNFDTADPEVQVRFAGFGAEEDEWVNIKRHVRQRSLPCEASECVAVLPGDLILCFQEGKDQALYFDAHVLDAQRRRHDEIVPLRKVCRRPETDYRLQQLHAMNDSVMVDHQKTSADLSASTATRVTVSSAEMMHKQVNANIAQGAPLSHSFVSVPAQTVEPKNASASSGISSSNPAVPPGGAAVISGTAATTAATGHPS
ncbi:protein SAWADEE HOMEODOMAIN-like protein 2 [Citrus sinensis]|nr:protein SAWADEE HOMEODOMAIN-like protein 2 [Citrus sinensis]